MKKPLISVVMPVYNNEIFLEEAINSILNQTYDYFEFIIINDGSSDGSSEIITNIKDSRMKLFNYTDNKGNYHCRNQGCRLANGKYIAVMDSDDWAYPERFRIQVEILENNSDLLACGCIHEDFEGKICFRSTFPQMVKVNLLYNNALLHPSLMIRKEVLQSINYYNEKFYYAADYDLVCRIALHGDITNLPDILMKYRKHESQISLLHLKEQTAYANEIRINYLRKCGFVLDTKNELLFTKFMANYPDLKVREIKKLISLLSLQNLELKRFNPIHFNYMFERLFCMYRSANL